jgi:hypothetical protein
VGVGRFGDQHQFPIGSRTFLIPASLINSPIIKMPIGIKIRTTQGLDRKRRRKADKKMRAMPSNKIRLVMIILLNTSFIGTSKKKTAVNTNISTAARPS